MDQDTIIRYITDSLACVELLRPEDGPGAGDTFFYTPSPGAPDYSHRLPFATIVTKDYAGWDEPSQLDRPGVFRLNIGVSRETFRALFNHPPTAESTKTAGYDFAALDRLMPHPTYAAQSWVCVLNPSEKSFEAAHPLLAEAYARAAARHAGTPT